MSFLAPAMLVGLIALAVPIIIHLIGRRRARVVKFAALDFLLATKRRTARRFRLREHVLLMVRVVACAAIVFALAKPFTSCEGSGPQVTRGPQAAVLVIDDSFASGYVVDDQPWLSRATAEARKILIQLGPEAEVAIVRASEVADHPSDLTRDHLRLRDQLLTLTPSARPADTSRALAKAAQLLAASSHRRKTVYVLGLLARNGIRPNETLWGADGPSLVVLDLRPSNMPNFAVTNLQFKPEPTAGTRGVAFDVEVANFSDQKTTAELSLAIADRVVARGTLELPTNERRTKRFLASLPPGARATDASVSIGGDALAIDDQRWARASLRDQVRVLLVDGDPRTVRHDDELFYLEAALRPGDREDSRTQLTTITAEDLAGITPSAKATAGAIDLDSYDVIVLANVPALPSDQVGVIANWVRTGGGILVAPGSRVDAAAYDRTMIPLLPQSLRDPIDTAWGAATEKDRDSRALHLVKWEADHPVFAPFSKSAPELADAKFHKVVLLGPTTATADRKVLARFTNGGAALVEASIGTGRTLLFTSTIDRDWNDLAIHPGFLPLMQQAVRHLARKPAEFGMTEHVVGGSVALPIGDLKKLEVRGPANLSAAFDGDRISGRSTVRFGKTERPGVYRVVGTDRAGATRDRDELAFAVNVDPRGSDLTPVASSALPASGTGAGADPASQQRRVELWHGLAAALLLLLLLEGVLVQR